MLKTEGYGAKSQLKTAEGKTRKLRGLNERKRT
jgi:hypothetical protein